MRRRDRDAAIYAEQQISPVRYQHQLNWLAQQGHATPHRTSAHPTPRPISLQLTGRLWRAAEAYRSPDPGRSALLSGVHVADQDDAPAALAPDEAETWSVRPQRNSRNRERPLGPWLLLVGLAVCLTLVLHGLGAYLP